MSRGHLQLVVDGPPEPVPAPARRKVRIRRTARRSPWLGLRKPSYKRNYRLQAHEDEVLLALIIERGCARWTRRSAARVARDWCQREPGRFDEQYLKIALKRVARQSDFWRLTAREQGLAA